MNDTATPAAEPVITKIVAAVKRNWPIVTGVGVVVVTIIAVVYLSVSISVTNSGNRWQERLNAQYESNKNSLSSCNIRIEQNAQVSVRNSKDVTAAIENTIAARNPQTQEASSGKLFSALQEAYPDTKNITQLYEKVMVVIEDCRSEFADKQDRMLDLVRGFKSWRNGSATVRWFGDEFPTADLTARSGDAVLTGKAALDKMGSVVIDQNAADSFETGRIDNTDVFGG